MTMNANVTPLAAPSVRKESIQATRHRTLARWLRRGAALSVALALLGFIVYAWVPKPIAVDVVTARRGSMRVTVDEVGKTRVKDRYAVSAPLTGSVERIVLRPGDEVKAGQVLAHLLSTEPPLLDARTRAQSEARVATATANRLQALAAVERAQTAAEHAGHDLENAERLAKSGAVSSEDAEHARVDKRLRDEELASARFALQVTDHELEVARLALRRSGRAKNDETIDIVSPVAGRVLRVIQESAGVVQGGAPLVEVGDPTALEIVSDVLTTDAVNVHSAARVAIERWGGDHALQGHVRTIEPSAFTRVSALGVEEQRVHVVVDLDDPQDAWAALGDGFRVELRIVTWEGANVLAIPSSAAFRRGDGWAAFVASEGVARVRPITPGRRNAADVQVLMGIDEGARVLVHPTDRVEDGVRIEAQ
jgi:HlyD family secretion protein